MELDRFIQVSAVASSAKNKSHSKCGCGMCFRDRYTLCQGFFFFLLAVKQMSYWQRISTNRPQSKGIKGGLHAVLTNFHTLSATLCPPIRFGSSTVGFFLFPFSQWPLWVAVLFCLRVYMAWKIMTMTCRLLVLILKEVRIVLWCCQSKSGPYMVAPDCWDVSYNKPFGIQLDFLGDFWRALSNFS